MSESITRREKEDESSLELPTNEMNYVSKYLTIEQGGAHTARGQASYGIFVDASLLLTRHLQKHNRRAYNFKEFVFIES
jgi:hypothetical protein